MPRPKSDLVAKKISLHDGDWEKLQAMFPVQGPTIAIRQLVRTYIAKHYRPSDPADPGDVEV